jgi:starch synthase
VAQRIALLTSEATPFAKTGGLADVTGALAKYLHGAGHDVRLFMPLYSSIDRARWHLARVPGFADLPLQFGGHAWRFDLWSGVVPQSGAPALFVDCPALYARPAIYTSDPDEHLRYLALTHAVFEVCIRSAWSPRIMHFNDWHTAFGPLLLKTIHAGNKLFERTRSVLTIHNIGYQGMFGAAQAGDIGLGAFAGWLHQDDLRHGRVNSLKHGVMYADAITTVSPTYAREILTPQFGMGLEGALRERGSVLSGILNGVDYDDWDPGHDRFLPRPYSAQSLDLKAGLKQEFLQRLHLRFGPRTALFGVVSRFTAQKGFDLLFDTLPAVLSRRDLCLVALGNGEAKYEGFFTSLQQRFPERVVYHRGYSEEMAHWIEAASDVFLMPSLYEPCGLNQMYSLRYGTIPIVRRTGGLADSVEMWDGANQTGTGIVFNDFNTEAMSWAMNTAFDLYAKPKTWHQLMQNAMAQDFSWQRQGALYVDLYSRLTG